MLRLAALGPLLIETGAGPATIGSRKAQALLLLLALRRGGQVPREVVARLLWADSPAVQARASLRQTLATLRRELGEAGRAIVSNGDEILLAPGLVSTDLADFEALGAREDVAGLTEALNLCRGEIAEGLPAVTPEFDRWLDAERTHLQARVSTLLLRLCDAQSAAGDQEASIATAHRLIAIDPLQEHVHRRLIQAYLRLKRHDAALKQFDSLKSVLERELGVEPEPLTIDLIRKVRLERSSPGAALLARDPVEPRRSGPMVPGRPSIAVLPFRSLNQSPDSAFIGDGICDDIIIELARDAGLMVVSRASSTRFDPEGQDVRSIGEALGVRFVLMGSLRVQGDRLRITAHLVETVFGQEVWAERYDRDLNDIFDVQIEIARTVAATVVNRINAAAVSAAVPHSAGVMGAVALVIQGERHLDEYSEPSIEKAIGLFREATVIAPTFARAHGFLALGMIYLRWYYRFDLNMDEVMPVAERAIALDWRDAKGHCALAMAHLLTRDFDRAAYHFETSLSLNPNDDRLLIEYGRYLMYADQPEEGLMRVREAMRLNPYHPNWYWNIMGRCLHTLGRYEEALDVFRRIQAPPFYVHAYISACHRMLGDDAAADLAHGRMLAGRPDLDAQQFRRVFPYRNETTGRLFFESMFG